MNEKKQMMMIDSASAEALLDRIDFLQNKILPELKEITSRAEEIKTTNKELEEIRESVTVVYEQSAKHIKHARFVKEGYDKSISNMQNFFTKLGQAQEEILDRQNDVVDESIQKLEENQAKQLKIMTRNKENIEYFYAMSQKMVKDTHQNLYEILRKFNKNFNADLLESLQASLIDTTGKAVEKIKDDQNESLKRFEEIQETVEDIQKKSEKNLKRYGKYLKIFNAKALFASFVLGLGIGLIIAAIFKI